jgi:beta-glucosidase
VVAFPQGFWWGTAASSPQAEGAAPASDWRAWQRARRVPHPCDGNGFDSRYAEDFALYASFGLRHHRLGIEWARIEPEEGVRDLEAVTHYRDMLQAARAAGIAVWVCLHHFSLPTWVAAGGVGFCDSRARDHWRRHVDFVADTFGDLVFGWQPVNEPAVYAANGFLAGVIPPGRQDWDLAMTALEGAHLASATAAQVMRQTGRPVSTVHGLSPLFAADDARETRDRLDDVMWRCWTRATRDGVLQVPGRAPVEASGMTDFDLVGFSYYSAFTVREPLALGPYPPGARTGPLGYAPWSEGLGLVLDRHAAELPGKPLLVAEHGVGTDDDAWRCEILGSSLDLLSDRINGGLDVRGFFHWTGVDNDEWAEGDTVPFGVFDRDRRPRPSAELLKSFAQPSEVLR